MTLDPNKLVPEMVTEVPTGPDVGLKLVIAGFAGAVPPPPPEKEMETVFE